MNEGRIRREEKKEKPGKKKNNFALPFPLLRDINQPGIDVYNSEK